MVCHTTNGRSASPIATTGSSFRPLVGLITVDVDVLGSLYLGDVRPSTMAAFGRLDVLDAAALPVADRLFGTGTGSVPWAGTFF